MKNLIDQTVKDIQAGQQSWRVLVLSSGFALISTVAMLAIV